MYALKKGTTLHQRYKILDSIGQGSFGIVYLVHDSVEGKQKAIKELFIKEFCVREENNHVAIACEESKQSEYEEKFQELEKNMIEEYRVLSQIDSPLTLTLYEHFHAHNTLYLVMEYIHAHTLDDEFSHSILPWKQTEIAHLLRELCQVLAPLHQKGYIHSDIKPSNIMVIKAQSEDSRLEYRYALVDYSNIKSFKPMKRVQNFIGNEAFAPPEYKNERHFYASSDLYSLGMVAYSLLAHIPSPPTYYKREDVKIESQFQKQIEAFDIDAKYQEALAKMTALNPKERYPSLSALGKDIQCKKPLIAPLILLPFIAVVVTTLSFVIIQPKHFVKLDITPKEANITIDNHPFDANETYPQGRHTIHIEAQGYEPYDDAIELPREKSKAIELKPINKGEANSWN